ncbi:MAG: MlaD family protein [Candidatus Dormibacteria bacterium]
MATLRRVLDRAVSSRLALLTVLGGAAVAGFAFLGSSSSHQITAYFADANGLTSGNEVRVAGIEIGSVQSIQVAGGQAKVVLEVDAAHWPLHRGTRIAVKPKGVLSNMYVDLQPGSAGSPALADDHSFGVGETSSPVNLDAFSNIFDPEVRVSIRTQLQEGPIAFGGTGANDLNTTLAYLNPLSRDLQPITAVLAQRSPELDRLNGEFATISGDLAREDGSLRGLISNADITFGALAARQHELQGTLDHAAGTLTTLDAGLRGEEGNLAAIFRKGPASLRSAKAASDALTPLITDVNPHIPDLNVLLNELITATGYQGDPSGIDTLRVDGTPPPGGYSQSSCGGEPAENPCGTAR